MTEKSGKILFALLAYNHEQFIEQCIRSLAEQTYRNFSVVFIDDGSTDQTFEMGKALLREANIDATCIQSQDNGICRNLNLALRTCDDGEFFTLFSADDWLYPNSFEERIQVLSCHPTYAMVYAPVTLYWEKEQRFELLKKSYTEGSVFKQLLEENFIPANAAMIRIRVFEEIGQFDESLAVEDWDMWLRIARRYAIGFLDKPVAYYRQHASNMSRNARMMSTAALEILKKHMDSDVSARRYSRLQVQHSVNFDPLGAAALNIARHGTPDLFTARQLTKLVVRGLRGRSGGAR